MNRLIAFILCLLVACFSPWWLFMIAVGVYGLRWNMLELVVLAAFIDGYYSAGTNWPMYTLTTTFLTIAVVYLRPYIKLYKADN